MKHLILWPVLLTDSSNVLYKTTIVVILNIIQVKLAADMDKHDTLLRLLLLLCKCMHGLTYIIIFY